MFAPMNPRPCGFYGDSQKACTCADAAVTKYQKRISCPLLDRIDIHIEVPCVDYEKLSGDRLGETSISNRSRVQTAREIQNKRFANVEFTDLVSNADMRVGEIRQFCKLQDEGQSLMGGGDATAQFVGKSLSPHPETILDDCEPGAKRRDQIPAFGRGVAV